MLVAGSVLAVGLICTTADALVTGDRIRRDVAVSGIDVGGLDKAQAAGLLRDRLEEASRRPARLRYLDKTWALDPRRLAFRIDYERSARRAWLVGRTGGVAAMVVDRVRSWVAATPVEPVTSVNRDALDAVLGRAGKAIDRPAVNADLRVSGTRVVRIKASEGLKVRRRAARNLAMALMSSTGRRDGAVPVRRVPAAVDDAGIGNAYEQAVLMMARPIYLAHRKAKWRVSRAEIGRWITIRRRISPAVAGEARIVAEARLQRSRVERAVASITRRASVPARNASFLADGERVRIVPSKTGKGIDTDKAYRAIAASVRHRRYRLVRLSLKPLEPSVTTARAKAMGITTRLGSFTTTYDPDATARVSNIQLLAGSLNNTLVAPGKSFSFNRTIGPRTAAKGYQEAPAIVGGELVPSLGGGVCQVATTLFNALFFSGLDIVERRNHSFYISHYPDGRDATVSYEGPDLAFRNDTKAWVLVKVGWGDDWVTISVYGADVGNEVTYTTGKFHDFVPAPLKRVADPTLPVGRTIVEDVGIRGREISVRRVVRRDGRVIHEDVFESHYEPKVGRVRVGTKPPRKAPKSKEPTTTPAR